jgi:uncharacterized membrane protein YjjP (DUF1212 family)
MTERNERERLAVLEHRADRMEYLIEQIGGWMKELTAVQNTLVRIETARSSDLDRIANLEQAVKENERNRIAQHEQTRQWASEDEGLTRVNRSWIDWFKMLLVALAGAGFTLWMGGSW